MSGVDTYLNQIDNIKMREQALILNTIFKETTGYDPVLWNGRMIGYGTYDYTYDSGRSGTFIATGFSVLKSRFSIHILPGYTEFPDIQARLGKVKYGKSCAYVNKLEDIDLGVLPELIRAGLNNLNSIWPVQPT